MFVTLLFFGILSAGFLIRGVLILIGWYKDPILTLFQRYGGDDPIYYPLPLLLFWLGVQIMSAGWIIQSLFAISFPSTEAGFLLWFLAYLAQEFQRPAHDAKPVLPGWYRRLMHETSRTERRRVAYMWLRLPLRTRLLYNASDRHFFLWVDLVIIATIEEV